MRWRTGWGAAEIINNEIGIGGGGAIPQSGGVS